METIALASADPHVLDRMETQVPAFLRKSASVVRIDPRQGFLEFLRYEIPDLVVFQAGSDPRELVTLFEGLEQDPWLDAVGIILVVPEVEDVIEACQGFNIAYFLNERDLERYLGRVIRILDENRDLLSHDGLIKKITVLSGEVTLETDLLLVQYYSSLFSNYLFRDGLVDRGRKFEVKLALEELLTNSMEHGNAGLGFDEKTQAQEAGQSIQDLVEERMSRPPFQGRKVTLGYSIGPRSSRFVLTDEGDGFDTTQVPTRQAAVGFDLSHGRGIFLSLRCAESLVYNPKGNEVVVTFLHNGKAERSIPPGFIDNDPRLFSPGDVVFWENSTGDHIYYIVSGEYEVVVGGKKVARLGPADVFMGEMSFLLGNRRTATVLTSKPGKLVEISRQAFTEAVKRFPNYGIFLSKLLARRLRDSNRQFAG